MIRNKTATTMTKIKKRKNTAKSPPSEPPEDDTDAKAMSRKTRPAINAMIRSFQRERAS
jgi:hypothetical protein